MEAKRRPAAEPQGPDDATFFATVVRIRDKVDEPKIEINVDGDNVIPNDAAPPDAFLAILGLRIELRVSGGVTQIQEDRDAAPGQPADEFAGAVQSVDVGADSFTLDGGTVVRLTDDTVIEQDGDLFSLAAAADAVAQGRPVRAEGRGTVESNDPLTPRRTDREVRSGRLTSLRPSATAEGAGRASGSSRITRLGSAQLGGPCREP